MATEPTTLGTYWDVFRRPDNVPGVVAPRYDLPDDVLDALSQLVDSSALGVPSQLGRVLRHWAPLFRFGLSRLRDGLSGLNNLLLPPLFTIILVDLVQGACPP